MAAVGSRPQTVRNTNLLGGTRGRALTNTRMDQPAADGAVG